ncbi:PAS domain S-box protein [Streptomyces cadmiisoli]|nr:PAS domain S-box protein [Streptomyces cadmiisoli]
MESGPGERDVPAADVDAALLTALFAAVDVGVYAVDDEGTVIACNPAAEQLLGYPPGTLIGVNAHRTLHPPALERATSPLHRPYPRRHGVGRADQRRPRRTAAGRRHTLQVSWTAAPLPTATEHGEGAVVVFHDATAQRVREGRRAERYAHSETMREQAEYDLAETTWLGELTPAMTSTLNADEALHRLVRQPVPRLADTALIDLAGGGTQRRVAAAHHAAGLLPTGLSGEPLSEHPAHQAAVARVVRGGGTRYLENLAATAGDEATCPRSRVSNWPPTTGRPSTRHKSAVTGTTPSSSTRVTWSSSSATTLRRPRSTNSARSSPSTSVTPGTTSPSSPGARRLADTPLQGPHLAEGRPQGERGRRRPGLR